MDLKTRYHTIRVNTEKLCKNLQTEDFIPQPSEFASPPKWHLGHTTWFFEEMILKPYLDGYKELDPKYNFIFNSYYESIGSHIARNQRGILTRPSVTDVYNYRSWVDENMDKLIKSEGFNHVHMNLIELGLQHEQQHQELLVMDTKYLFYQNPLRPIWDKHQTLDKYAQCGNSVWLPIDEGVYDIGYNGPGFCYDNELNEHKQYIHRCAISSQLVTVGEYYEFIREGGYMNPMIWLSEGWNWVESNQIRMPLYWYQNQYGEYNIFHINGPNSILEVHKTPVLHLTFYEADAYAKWKGCRLPTEFEWEVAARLYYDEFKSTTAWQWTNSAYLPYPGFATLPGAIGEYNGKFMINQMVLRGGCLATPEGHYNRHTYRNFYHPNMNWMFSGIRLAKSI
jgi:ergothioneine biosynthesis protein EgtB